MSNQGFFHNNECRRDYVFKNTEKVLQKSRQLTKKQHTRDRQQFNLKDRSKQLKLAQSAFNKYIRLRDKDLPCISCQRHHNGQYHAGHFKSVGAHPELRFNENNNHKQCAPCNNHLSGNQLEYRINLIKKIGLDKVEALECWSGAKKYTIDEIIEVKDKYLRKCKKLSGDNP